MTYPILLNNFIIIQKSYLPEFVLEEIRKVCTYKNPQYYPSIMMGIRGQRELIKTYNENSYYINIARGEFYKIKKILTTYSISMRLEDARCVGKKISFKLKDIEERDYQQKAIDVIGDKTQYILNAPCGSGKTTMALMLINKLKVSTLVVVPQSELQSQWVSVIKARGVFDFEIGRIDKDHKELKPITIALFQSLNNYTERQWEDINKKFGCIILDECHRVSCLSLYRIVNSSKAKYRYGLSATLNRKDKMEFLLHAAISDNVFKITDADLEKEGVYMPASVEFIPLNFPVQTKPPRIENDLIIKESPNDVGIKEFYRILTQELIDNTSRTREILENVLQKVSEGHKSLVLCSRVAWSKYFYELLQKHDVRSALLIGEVSKEKRKEILEDFKNNKLDIIVATDTIAKEGLDLPNLSNVHLVIPPSNNIALEQMCGRALRPFKDKVAPVICDYVDVKSAYLWKAYDKRTAFYRKKKYTFLNKLT